MYIMQLAMPLFVHPFWVHKHPEHLTKQSNVAHSINWVLAISSSFGWARSSSLPVWAESDLFVISLLVKGERAPFPCFEHVTAEHQQSNNSKAKDDARK